MTKHFVFYSPATLLVGLVLAVVGSACSGCGSASSVQSRDVAAAGSMPGGNATSGNATSGNATGGNATSGNSTSGNATSGNSSSAGGTKGKGGGDGTNGGTAPTQSGAAGQNSAGNSTGGATGGAGSSAGGITGGGSTSVVGSYGTDFSLNESPISESGVWKHTGLDWATISTAKGLAYGTQTGNGGYDDSYAYLSGFPPDQAASAVVHRDPAISGSTTHEVEILLRWSDAPHSASGYECNFAYDGTYASIVRWNGPKGDFTVIDGQGGTGKIPGGLHDGDVVKAQIVGSVITTFVNGKQIQTTTDTVIKQGNPGIGMWRGAPSTPLDDYAFTSYVATPLSK